MAMRLLSRTYGKAISSLPVFFYYSFLNSCLIVAHYYELFFILLYAPSPLINPRTPKITAGIASSSRGIFYTFYFSTGLLLCGVTINDFFALPILNSATTIPNMARGI